MQLAAHFGLRPRRPERLLVLAGGIVLAALLAIVLLVLALTGEFGRHSPREFYYLWLAGLIVAALALARRPTWAAALLTLAAVDLGIGVGSHALARSGAPVVSVMPPPYYPGPGYLWHPLLQAVLTPSVSAGRPDLPVNHTSAATRGREHTRADLEAKRVVALFGGSTTYDMSVADGETWADRLEQLLGQLLGADRFAVINHGVPGYSTAEHVLQTAFYADAFGRKPDCAVYYVGWNDMHNAGLPDLDPAYADHHLPRRVDVFGSRRISIYFYTPSPLLTIIVRFVAVGLDTVRPITAPAGPPIDRPDAVLERFFLQHVEAISAINRARGIKTLWIGQILNRAVLTGDEPSGWTPFIRRRDLWPMQARLNGLLRDKAQSAGDVHVDVPVEAFQSTDFFDMGHFTPAGSAKFAELIAPLIAEHCR